MFGHQLSSSPKNAILFSGIPNDFHKSADSLSAGTISFPLNTVTDNFSTGIFKYFVNSSKLHVIDSFLK